MTDLLLESFDARDAAERAAVAERLRALLEASGAGEDEPGPVEVPPHPGLIGLPDALYEQIEALLQTKQHLIFYGPPGTGKTTIAEYVARVLSPGKYAVATASSDWSSQDVIGGYQPVKDTLRFVKGLLLENFDRPVVIDELNRTDIDRAMGPLFTVLSGHSVTLPYLVDLEDPSKGRHEIRVGGEASESVHAPTPAWRLLATLNTLDKASLYQMSYALSRRFGWVLVDAPADEEAFLREYLEREDDAEDAEDRGETLAPLGQDASPGLADIPLAEVWKMINGVRRIGPAPYIDIIAYCRKRVDGPSFYGAPSAEMAPAIVEGLAAFVVPMLDGISSEDADGALAGTARALGLEEGTPPYALLAQALREVAA